MMIKNIFKPVYKNIIKYMKKILKEVMHRVHIKQILIKHLREISNDKMEGRKAGSRGHKMAQAYIVKQLKKHKIDPFKKHYRHKINNNNEMRNIIGIKHANKDAGTIVLSAHYDHLGKQDDVIYNGADDNASGVAVLLTFLELLRKTTLHHNIIFAFFDGEEQQLVGSKDFVKKYKKEVNLNINLDMLCNNDIYFGKKKRQQGLFINGDFDRDILGEDLMKKLRYNPTKELTWKNNQDGYSFAKAAIPSIYLGVDDFDHYHTERDTFESIDLDTFYKHFKLCCKVIMKIAKHN